MTIPVDPPVTRRPQIERAVVNALLWLPGMADEVADRLDTDLFADPWCRSVVGTVLDLLHRGFGVDAVSVHLQRVAEGHVEHFSAFILADVTQFPMAMAVVLLGRLVDSARRQRLGRVLVSAAQGLTTARTVDAIAADLLREVAA